MAARRVASEMGEAVGETVGYQVRFEEVAGPRTRLRFLTEGVLVRRLLWPTANWRASPRSCLDEFHERHLDGDLALALLRRLQRTRRPDLKLVVMSATLGSLRSRRFLGGCPILRSQGRLFDIAMEYRRLLGGAARRTGIWRRWSGSRARAPRRRRSGLPSRRRRDRPVRARACASLARSRGIDVSPLHGDLSAEEQDRAVSPSARRKLILSTNVAESSITVEGVRAVIDTGLARFASDSPWTGLPTLTLAQDQPGLGNPARRTRRPHRRRAASCVSTPPTIFTGVPKPIRRRSCGASCRNWFSTSTRWESAM